MRTITRQKAVVCWIGILLVFLFGKFALGENRSPQFDKEILAWFAGHRGDELDLMFTSITWAGSRLLLIPIIAVLAFILILRRNAQGALFLVGSFFGASFLGLLLKRIVARPRPYFFQAIGDIPTGFSYPSSHAIQITVFVLALMLVSKVHMGPYGRIVLGTFGGLLILLVCLSRLYLQVHYPTDVMAGFLTGLFWTMGLAVIAMPANRDTTIPLGKCRMG